MRRILIVLAGTVFLGCTAWYLWFGVVGFSFFRLESADHIAEKRFADSQAHDTARVAPPGFLRYRSAPYHFSVFYPKELIGREFADGNTNTITFEDGSGEKAFQIFIVPYTLDHIDAARFRDDIPSGIIQGQTDILVDGVRASMFFSTNQLLGDTREVWVIHDGYLYEITTYKELDTWLAGIMQTWKFSQ